MRRLRIAQLSKDCSANGGVGTYVRTLCTALGADGHEVIVIHADPGMPLPPPGVAGQFYVDGFDKFGSKSDSRRSASRVIEILEALSPHVVHIQANNNFLLEMEVRQRFPVIKTLHVYDFCPSGNKFHHALEKICNHSTGPLCLARMGYKRCVLSKRPSVIWWHYRRCVEANKNNANYPRLIVASEYVKRQAVASGYPASQIEVIPCFTTLPVLPDSAIDGEKKVLFVGRVVREKGLDHLLSALSLVRTPWRLTVCGDGPDLERVKQLTRRLGLDGWTEFTGWVDKGQLLQFYHEASLMAVPSLWPEPFGMVGIEAMSYGKPVVAFNVGGISEWLGDGVTGFLVKPYDTKEMAEKLGYLLEHPGVAHEMGMRGRARVAQEFNEETHITRLLKIYGEVSGARIQPSTIAS